MDVTLGRRLELTVEIFEVGLLIVEGRVIFG
jgi:hypothetical protein